MFPVARSSADDGFPWGSHPAAADDQRNFMGRHNDQETTLRRCGTDQATICEVPAAPWFDFHLTTKFNPTELFRAQIKNSVAARNATFKIVDVETLRRSWQGHCQNLEHCCEAYCGHGREVQTRQCLKCPHPAHCHRTGGRWHFCRERSVQCLVPWQSVMSTLTPCLLIRSATRATPCGAGTDQECHSCFGFVA